MRKRLIKVCAVLLVNLLLISSPAFAFYQENDNNLDSMIAELKKEGHNIIRTINSEGYETIIVDNGAEIIVKIPVEDILRKRPDLKEAYNQIIEEHNESIITPNAGISPGGKLYTTVKYVFKSSLPYFDPTKDIVWRFNNTTSQWVKAQLSGQTTASCFISSEYNVVSKTALEKSFEVVAGVKLNFSLTQSVTTEYGTQIDVAPKMSYTIYSQTHYRVYGYQEEYWFWGTLVDSVPLGVFKPVGFEWTLERKSI